MDVFTQVIFMKINLNTFKRIKKDIQTYKKTDDLQ